MRIVLAAMAVIALALGGCTTGAGLNSLQSAPVAQAGGGAGGAGAGGGMGGGGGGGAGY